MDNLMEILLEKIGKIEVSLYTNKPILNIDEVSELTGISKSTLYKLTSAREIPHFKKAKHLFFDREEVLEWLKSDKILTNLEIRIKSNTFITLNKK